VTRVLVIASDDADGPRFGELDGNAIAVESDLMDLDAIEFPDGTTDAQKYRARLIARDHRATRVDVWSHQFDLPADWIYVAVHLLHGGEFHAGIAPDGSAHS
jgi:hypothetical protein